MHILARNVLRKRVVATERAAQTHGGRHRPTTECVFLCECVGRCSLTRSDKSRTQNTHENITQPQTHTRTHHVVNIFMRDQSGSGALRKVVLHTTQCGGGKVLRDAR